MSRPDRTVTAAGRLVAAVAPGRFRPLPAVRAETPQPAPVRQFRAEVLP